MLFVGYCLMIENLCVVCLMLGMIIWLDFGVMLVWLVCIDLLVNVFVMVQDREMMCLELDVGLVIMVDWICDRLIMLCISYVFVKVEFCNGVEQWLKLVEWVVCELWC